MWRCVPVPDVAQSHHRHKHQPETPHTSQRRQLHRTSWEDSLQSRLHPRTIGCLHQLIAGVLTNLQNSGWSQKPRCGVSTHLASGSPTTEVILLRVLLMSAVGNTDVHTSALFCSGVGSEQCPSLRDTTRCTPTRSFCDPTIFIKNFDVFEIMWGCFGVLTFSWITLSTPIYYLNIHGLT